MDLIFFVHQNACKKGTAFKRAMEQNFKHLDIEFFQTFNVFKARLKQIPVYDKEIYVLLADSKKRLKELTELIDLLEDRRIVLIIPDNSETTISTAHRFFPRFFTYLDDNYNDLYGVLNKMITPQKEMGINKKKEDIHHGKAG